MLYYEIVHFTDTEPYLNLLNFLEALTDRLKKVIFVDYLAFLLR